MGLGIVKDFLPHEFHVVVRRVHGDRMIMEIIDIPQRLSHIQLGVVLVVAAINIFQRIAQRERKAPHHINKLVTIVALVVLGIGWISLAS